MRKHSVLMISVLRKIKGTLGRYLAIFAIIALGVGFFAGLRVTSDAMIQTVNNYLREKRLYDFRLISTLGFREEDVAAFAGLEGIEAAAGSVSTDFLCGSADGDIVFRAHVLTEDINRVELAAGRMPQTGNECLLDGTYFGAEQIGTVLTVSEANTEDTRGMFAYDSYTVVGLVNVPYYANFERGSTALGRGVVSGFICLPPEGFATDYYTEIYLSLGECGDTFSDPYNAAVDAAQPAVTALLEARAADRYESLKADAWSEIDAGQAELSDGRKDYRKERAETEQKLSDALEKLNSARAELDDGWKQLAEGKEELQTQKSDAELRLSEARRQLDSGWVQLQNGKQELALKQREAQQGFAEAEAQLENAAGQIAQGEAQLNACQNLYAVGESLTSGINAGLGTSYGTPNELIGALSSNPLLCAAADSALSSYGMTAQSFCNTWAQTEEQLGAPLCTQTLAALSSSLDDARAKYDQGEKELEAKKAAAQASFAEAQSQLTASEAQLIALEAEYTKNRAAANDATEEAEKALADSEQTLRNGEQEYTNGLREYEDSKAKAEEAFAEAEQKLADGERELQEAREALNTFEAPATFVLDRTANVACATLEHDIGIVRGVSRVFPLFFFLVAALVCVTTMTRMVDEQRTQNGVLKALGYGNGAIIGQYLFYAGSASILGCIAGFLLGSRFLPMALWRVYRIIYSINRPIAFVLDWKLFLACTALFQFCSLGATFLVCFRDLRESAAELIRPLSPPAGKRIFLERVTFLWKRLKFLHKVSVRNILRYKKRMVMMILGVGGCTALLLTGFGVRDSIRNILDYQYEEIETYDCSVTFRDALGEADMEAFRTEHEEELSGCVFLHVSPMDLIADGRTLSLNAVVFEEDLQGFVDLHEGEQHLDWPKSGETVLDYRISQEYGVKKGDRITLRDANMREITLTVSGIFDNYLFDYAFIRADTFREAWGAAPEIKSAYLNLSKEIDPHAAAASVLGDKNVAAVSLISDKRETIGSILNNMNYVVLIVLICSGALAFIVLYNLTNISINERRREIATLEVLGFYPNESAAYVFRENLILTGISALLGLPMGYALLWYVMRQIKISSFYFGCRAAPLSYVFAVALTFVFAAVVAFLLYFKLQKIDMADSLKAIE